MEGATKVTYRYVEYSVLYDYSLPTVSRLQIRVDVVPFATVLEVEILFFSPMFLYAFNHAWQLCVWLLLAWHNSKTAHPIIPCVVWFTLGQLWPYNRSSKYVVTSSPKCIYIYIYIYIFICIYKIPFVLTNQTCMWKTIHNVQKFKENIFKGQSQWFILKPETLLTRDGGIFMGWLCL